MLEKLTKKVRVVEVGPRDGLQNESTMVSVSDKVSFIKKLKQAKIPTIEAASFVRQQKIPQMANAKELLVAIKKAGLDIGEFPVLVPNEKGFEDALAAGATHFALLLATSETFNQKNINASISKSLEHISHIASKVDKSKHRLRCHISTVFGCPYEGKVAPKKSAQLMEKLLEMGMDEIVLADTIGAAGPRQVDSFFKEIKSTVDSSNPTLHFHDTRGMAIANVLVALEHGICSFDSSAGGLGGCPYAKGASGNVATEDVVFLMNSLGVETGIDLELLIQASSFILAKLKRKSLSKAYLSYKNGK